MGFEEIDAEVEGYGGKPTNRADRDGEQEEALSLGGSEADLELKQVETPQAKRPVDLLG